VLVFVAWGRSLTAISRRDIAPNVVLTLFSQKRYDIVSVFIFVNRSPLTDAYFDSLKIAKIELSCVAKRYSVSFQDFLLIDW
jgi:hypothetical protein